MASSRSAGTPRAAPAAAKSSSRPVVTAGDAPSPPGTVASVSIHPTSTPPSTATSDTARDDAERPMVLMSVEQQHGSCRAGARSRRPATASGATGDHHGLHPRPAWAAVRAGVRCTQVNAHAVHTAGCTASSRCRSPGLSDEVRAARTLAYMAATARKQERSSRPSGAARQLGVERRGHHGEWRRQPGPQGERRRGPGAPACRGRRGWAGRRDPRARAARWRGDR
jgi:hypothetical protein